MGHLDTLDLVIIVLYLLVVVGVAGWAARKQKDGSASYFLAGREAGWLLVGTSLFASNIGSEHLVGLAGSGAAGGLAVGHFEWLASLILLLLGWLFVPFYLASGVYTMPEFLERRYNSASRWYFTVISVAGYVLTKISVSLYAGGLILREVAGISLWWGAGVILVITGLYTTVGGLRAVLYTDMVQAFVLVIGTGLLVIVGLDEAGGWSAVRERAPEGFFDIWKAASHPDFPWTGIVFGAPVLAVWYWCTDQYIVQRTLSAKGLGSARSGTILAGYLKVLPMFLFVLPGVIALVLYPEVGQGSADEALPRLVVGILPSGLRGFFLAALLAALMSSLSSIFNSCSSLVTYDVYRKLRPEASEKRLVLVGRISTSLLVVLGLLWIPFMKHVSDQLYIYLQSVQGYIAPPIAACFLLGLLFDRINGRGAVTALISGLLLGGLRLGLELANGRARDGLPDGSFWESYAEINFLHFAALLFAFSIAVLVVVSLVSARPSPEKLRGLTVSSPPKRIAAEETEELPAPDMTPGRARLNVVLSLLLVLIVAILYLTFA